MGGGGGGEQLGLSSLNRPYCVSKIKSKIHDFSLKILGIACC